MDMGGALRAGLAMPAACADAGSAVAIATATSTPVDRKARHRMTVCGEGTAHCGD